MKSAVIGQLESMKRLGKPPGMARQRHRAVGIQARAAVNMVSSILTRQFGNSGVHTS